YKSVLVYDQYVQDWNACNYWNWHVRNLDTFSKAKNIIKWELGFIMHNPLGGYPDKYFTDSCSWHDGQHMYESIT
ncbi:hypothetical protein HDU96_002751, partial [Phlyctochytrium bullatum]